MEGADYSKTHAGYVKARDGETEVNGRDSLLRASLEELQENVKFYHAGPGKSKPDKKEQRGFKTDLLKIFKASGLVPMNTPGTGKSSDSLCEVHLY